MQDRSRFAFKEWAVVCEALDVGRQSLILRKGGIHEGRDGFRVEHREFWLYPTEFHQDPDVLAPHARPLLADVMSRRQTPGMIPIRNYVVVDDVVEIQDEALLSQLSGLHAWSESTLHARYRYRSPMLFALLVRTYRLEEPVLLTESTRYAGCRSWVDLDQELSTSGLVPALSDRDHAVHLTDIRRALVVVGS